jgi:hypothetical protein
MIETIWELISTDCEMPIWMMKEELRMSREKICKILVEDLS